MTHNRYRFYVGVVMWKFLERKRDVAGLPDGFSVFPARGMWKGKWEYTVVVEVITDLLDADALAGELARVYNQEAVLVTVDRVESWLIRPSGSRLDR